MTVCQRFCRSARFLTAIALSGLAVSQTKSDVLEVPADYPTIQSAINAAQGGDEIVVAPGTYTQALNLRGKAIVLRSANGPDVTFLNGTGLGMSVITCTSGESLLTYVNGFTIRNGAGAANWATCAGRGRAGGGALVQDGGLTIANCIFRDNGPAANSGGAIFAHNAQIEIVGCTFLRNGADAGYGGAVNACGAGSAAFQDCTFEDNGPAGHGGALLIATPFTILDCVFRRNESGFGGGANLSAGPGEVGRIENCTFEDGTAAHGGGLHAFAGEGSVIEVVHCTAAGNSASHGGGFLIDASEGAAIQLRDCAARGNTANFGAGFNLSAHEQSHVTLTGFESTDNTAAFGAGIMGHSSEGSSIELTNGIVTGNSAEPVADTGINSSECYVDDGGLTQWGGGADVRVYYDGTARLTNCLFADNTGPNGGNVHLGTCGGGAIDFANNTVVGSDSSGVHIRIAGGSSAGGIAGAVRVANSIIYGNADSQQVRVQFINAQNDPNAEASVAYSDVEGGFVGTGNIDADPRFVSAATGNYRLASGSPAIDAAANDRIPSGIVIDLSGAPRFVDDPATNDTGLGAPPLADLGAYEFQAACPADLDNDGRIGLQDLAILLAHFGSIDSPAADGDLDGDADVDLQDLSTMLASFGGGC
jgi:hypothetical protein